jgi:glyoxylase-like metal-dependent hydrolase (beta-lactamase superfamily II)
MAWSSSVVGPPNGDMAAYCASLRLLLARDDALYVPGHGPALPDPRPYVRDLLAHRMRREEAILRALAERPAVSEELVDRLYSQTDERLRRAAARNVMAHLLKLEAEERVVRQPGERWHAAAGLL